MGLDMYIRDNYGNEVAYWRKFNALHAWFVNNLQDGIDDCQVSRQITKDDLEKLIYTLESVKESPIVANVILPTSGGFFFGSTSYDSYFMQDVESSIPIFKDLLEQVNEGSIFYYQSSW